MTELSFSVKISDLFRLYRHLGKTWDKAVSNGHPLVCVRPLGATTKVISESNDMPGNLGLATIARNESPLFRNCFGNHFTEGFHKC